MSAASPPEAAGVVAAREALPAPAAMVTGVKLAYDDAGSGECVVLIHGHPFDRTLWQPQLAALRDGFRVVAPDLRGFGHSPVTPHLVTMREFAADIEELLGILGIRRAAVVGLSMGGLVTMELVVSARALLGDRPGRHDHGAAGTGRARGPARAGRRGGA